MAAKKRRPAVKPARSTLSRSTSVFTEVAALRRLDAERGRILIKHGIAVSRSHAFQIGLNMLLASPDVAQVLQDGALRRYAERRSKVQA